RHFLTAASFYPVGCRFACTTLRRSRASRSGTRKPVSGARCLPHRPLGRGEASSSFAASSTSFPARVKTKRPIARSNGWHSTSGATAREVQLPGYTLLNRIVQRAFIALALVRRLRGVFLVEGSNWAPC